jgi:hypothetical protein
MFFSLNNTIEIIVGVLMQARNGSILAHPEIESLRFMSEYRGKKRHELRVNIRFKRSKLFIKVVALFLNITHHRLGRF